MLTRTPHICCFVLVFFAVLISAVHAMPTPPSSPPRAHALIDSTLDRPFLPLDLPPFNVDKAEIDFDIEDLPKASPYRLTMLHAFDSSTTFPIFGSTARRGFTSTITKRLLAGKLKFPENNNGIRYTNKEVDKDSSIRDILPDDVIFVFEALEPNAPICGGVWACVGYRRKSKMGTFSAIYVIEPNVKIQKLRVFYHDGEPSRGSDEARKKQGNIFHTQFWTLHRDKIEAGWSKLKEAIERRDLEQRKTDQDSTNKRKRKEYKGRGGNKRNGNKKLKASNPEAELPTEAHAKEKADKAGSGTNSPTPETEAHTREKAGSGMALDTHPQPQPQHGGSNEGEGNQAGSSAQDTRMALSNILGNYEA